MEGHQILTAFLPQSETFNLHRSEFYQLLDIERAHTRLMHIHPGPFEDEIIRVTVSDVDLADEPEFEAISYTWADTGRTKEILLHGHPYNVTRNQYAALRRLRRLDRPRTMWMDVVCIDQANVEERSYQVSMMGKIFASSLHTVIWLSEIEDEWLQGISDHEWDNSILGRRFHTQCQEGQEMPVFAAARVLGGVKGAKSTELMRTFREQKEQSNTIVRGAVLILEFLALQGHLCELPSYEVSDTEEVTFYRPWFESAKLLYRLLCHAWWSRVWVLQEVLLCKGQLTVVFGDNEIPYATFVAAADAFCHKVDNCRCCIMSATDMFLEEWLMPISLAFAGIAQLSLYSHISTPGRMTLANAATLTKKRHASDIRDFVYGILGLVRGDERVKVSYKIPAAKLFAQASYDLFRMNNALGLLEEGNAQTGLRLKDLPTWSLDWTEFKRLPFKHNWTFAMDKNEVADWNKIRFDSTLGSLEVEANELDSIRVLFKTESGPKGTEPFTNATAVKSLFSSWATQLRNLGVQIDIDHRTMKRETISALSKELFITIHRDTRVIKSKDPSDTTCARFGEEEWNDVVQWWIGLSEIVDLLAKNPEDLAMHGKYPREFPSFLTENLRTNLEDSSLALTMSGRLCMVPSVAQPGDRLYHVRTCKPPIILRAVPTSSDISHFQVVGSGFLHGAMGSAGWKPEAEEVICLV